MKTVLDYLDFEKSAQVKIKVHIYPTKHQKCLNYYACLLPSLHVKSLVFAGFLFQWWPAGGAIDQADQL